MSRDCGGTPSAPPEVSAPGHHLLEVLRPAAGPHLRTAADCQKVPCCSGQRGCSCCLPLTLARGTTRASMPVSELGHCPNRTGDQVSVDTGTNTTKEPAPGVKGKLMADVGTGRTPTLWPLPVLHPRGAGGGAVGSRLPGAQGDTGCLLSSGVLGCLWLHSTGPGYRVEHWTPASNPYPGSSGGAPSCPRAGLAVFRLTSEAALKGVEDGVWQLGAGAAASAVCVPAGAVGEEQGEHGQASHPQEPGLVVGATCLQAGELQFNFGA